MKIPSPTLGRRYLFNGTYPQVVKKNSMNGVKFIWEKLYRSGTVNSKSFVGKVLLRVKWKFELN